MRKFINKAMLTLGVFSIAIGSAFAMDTNPPTEPVKKAVETKATLTEFGYGYYDFDLGKCVIYIEGLPDDCSTDVSTVNCMVTIGGLSYHLYEIQRQTSNDPWECITPLYKKIE